MDRIHTNHEIRQTSLEAYEDIMKKLGQRQKLVYDAIVKLSKNGPYPTDREIAQELKAQDPNFVRPRRYELMKMGYIVEQEKRKCHITGKKALTWKPKELKRKK